MTAPMVALMIAATMPTPRLRPSWGQQPVANEGADDPDEEVADESEAGASHDLARQPSGHEADQQYDKETLA